MLEDFLWFGCRQKPRFSRDGVLIIGTEKGRRLSVDSNTAVCEQVLRRRRYGVISDVVVKNKVLGVSSVVENTEFKNRGGTCRRVVNVPRYTYYDGMRSTGDYQIEQSKADELSLSITLPELFAAFPGDIIELKRAELGMNGSYIVGRSRCFASADNMGTEIILTKREV